MTLKLCRTDAERLNWLEDFINRESAIVLHDGTADTGRMSGLGLRPGLVNRTLREAIDTAMKIPETVYELNRVPPKSALEEKS